MRAIFIAVSLHTLACGLAFAAAGGAHAAGPPDARLGPPYQANGVWFVPAADPRYDEEGVAAEYGAGLEGRRTVSGEPFDPRALTAAHATLPVPGLVQVTNMETHRTVVLRINDRGPYSPGRILGVTPASARALGMTPGRPAHVRVRYADVADRVAQFDRATPPGSRSDGAVQGYGVQVGAFAQRARAQEIAARAAAAGSARVTPVDRGGSTLYRVSIGPLADQRSAETVRDRLEGLGFTDARVVPPS